MTRTTRPSAPGETIAEPIDLNPGATFPPFAVWLRLPATWSRLDSNPATWRQSADRLIDKEFRGTQLRAGERKDLLAMLDGLVADCQRAGAALSLLTVGRRPAGGAASFGLHIAFVSEHHPASLGRVHDSLPRTGVISEVSTRTGPAVMHRDRVTMVVPGSAEIVALTSIQVFVPIPDSNWTLLLSTASAFAELTDPLESLVREVAESVGIDDPDQPSTHDLADTDPDWVGVGDIGGVDADRPATGIERGFGTLLARRIDPAPFGRTAREHRR